MTIEEKAKAYDEALERAKELLGSPRTCFDINQIEDIFPELRESEDERIRKELIEFIKWSVDRYFMREDFHQAKRPSEWIAYLEKQKYDRMKPIYDARESFESALEKAWNDYHNGYENVDKLEDDYVECAHAKGFREGYLFGIVQQKPAEWSEEDEKMLNQILGDLEWARLKAIHIKDKNRIPYEKKSAWLKSLRPQPHTVSIKNATKFGNLEYERGVKDGIQHAKNHQWKPSEEQMAALEKAIVRSCSHQYGVPLSELYEQLYEQLKKL